jgi:hypothetical protein
MIIVKAISKDGGVKFTKEFNNNSDPEYIYRLCKVYKGFAYVDKVIIEENNIITEFQD